MIDKINVVGNYNKSEHDASRVVTTDGLAPTVKENHGTVTGIMIKQATKKGYVECCEGGLADLSFPNSKTRRGRVQNGGTICPTITTESEIYRMCYRIRKLTPMECWRLMDFTDTDFQKAATVVSNAQLYKQAGNSIVVNVLVAIIGQMIEGKEDMYKERI
jgi:DNA (cytosine-5)-methyltransferase 1